MSLRDPSRVWWWNAWAACAAFTLLGFVLSLLRHYCFASFEDLAMFDQMLWNVRRGAGLVTTVSGNDHLMFRHHFFGEHVSPILYLVAPLAGLTRGPEALLFIQSLAVGLSALAVAAWARARTGSQLVAWIAPWVWVALPGLWMATLYDFHMECFGAALFFMFLLAFSRGSGWSLCWAILYMFTKEDAPLYLAATAFAGAFIFRQRRLGTGIFALALVYFSFVFVTVIPAFSPTGRHLLENRMPGADGADVFGVLRAVLGSGLRWESLARHLAGFGFLPLLGGLAALPGLAAAAIMWISPHETQFRILAHYPFTVYPLLAFAAVEGFALAFRARRTVLRRALFGAAVVVVIGGVMWAWAALGAEAGHVLGPVSARYARDTAEARAMLASIPADGMAATDFELAPHMARRDELSVLLRPADAEWLALHLNAPSFHFALPKRLSWFAWLAQPDSGYGLWAHQPGQVAVFRAGDDAGANEEFLGELTSEFEAEGMYREIARVVPDKAALNGWAIRVRPDDEVGPILWGPYVHLSPGEYRVTFRVRYEGPAEDFAELDVSESDGKFVRGRQMLRGRTDGYTDVTLPVTLETGQRVEFRCVLHEKADLRIDRVTARRVE